MGRIQFLGGRKVIQNLFGFFFSERESRERKGQGDVKILQKNDVKKLEGGTKKKNKVNRCQLIYDSLTSALVLSIVNYIPGFYD